MTSFLTKILCKSCENTKPKKAKIMREHENERKDCYCKWDKLCTF